MAWLKNVSEKTTGLVPKVSLPKIGREVEIPVYVIHNSRDMEDYYFIFDFEQFVERSDAGIFARPKLKVWAGRDDFSRRKFARAFREAFAREFDAAREAQQAGSGKARGWFSWGAASGIGAMLSGFVANIVLLVATSAGRAVLEGVAARRALQRHRSDAEKLEARIEDVQGRVDGALERLELHLHIELYRHAWRGQAPGPLRGMDYEAWPLPARVSRHLSG